MNRGILRWIPVGARGDPLRFASQRPIVSQWRQRLRTCLKVGAQPKMLPWTGARGAVPDNFRVVDRGCIPGLFGLWLVCWDCERPELKVEIHGGVFAVFSSWGVAGRKEEKPGTGGSNLAGKCWRAEKRNAISLTPCFLVRSRFESTQRLRISNVWFLLTKGFDCRFVAFFSVLISLAETWVAWRVVGKYNKVVCVKDLDRRILDAYFRSGLESYRNLGLHTMVLMVYARVNLRVLCFYFD